MLVGRLKRGATEQSMIIRGLRGVGKTVLLNAFEDRAESEGCLSFYHELTPDSSLVAEIARDAQSALARLKLSARATMAIREALRHLKTIKVVGPAGVELAVDLRKADEGTIARDLSELFLQLGSAAAEKGMGVVFLLDEVQFADEVQYRSVITALHRATQKNMPITLVAAGLPQIPRLTGEARSYAERLFTFPVIASLSPTDATAALVEPARQLGVDYEPEAVELALAWTEGYPLLHPAAWQARVEPRSGLTNHGHRRAGGDTRGAGHVGYEHLRGPYPARNPRGATVHARDGRTRSGAVQVRCRRGEARTQDLGVVDDPPAAPLQGTRVCHRGLRIRRLHRATVRRVHGPAHAVPSSQTTKRTGRAWLTSRLLGLPRAVPFLVPDTFVRDGFVRRSTAPILLGWDKVDAGDAFRTSPLLRMMFYLHPELFGGAGDGTGDRAAAQLPR